MKFMRLPIREVADINPRLSCRPSFDETVSFVPMAAVSEKTVAIEAPVDRNFSEVAKGFTTFQRGDVIVAKITPCFENGKMAHAIDLPRAIGIGSTEFHVIRPRNTLNGGYLFHMLRLPAVRIDGARKMQGAAGQRRVPADFFGSLEIPFPPLAEQKRIAGILDAADALRAKRRAALAQLDSLTQSLFLDLFGDPVSNPMGWPRKPIGEIGKVITGNTPPRANPGYYGGHIEWIKSDNINTPHYYLTIATEGLSESGKAVARTVPAGSILITCIAGSPECIGNAAMTDREVAFNQQINAFIPSDGDAHFLYSQMLVGKRLIQEASTSGMKGMVSKGRFEKIMLVLPPTSLQREFAAMVESIERQKTRQRAHLAELNALFASLQSRAFNGEL